MSEGCSNICDLFFFIFPLLSPIDAISTNGWDVDGLTLSESSLNLLFVCSSLVFLDNGLLDSLEPRGGPTLAPASTVVSI